MNRVLVATFVTITLLAPTDARGTTPPAICYAPGACITAQNPNINKSGYAYGGPPTYGVPAALNVYIAWGNDSVVPFTNAQKTVIIKLFQNMNSATWFQNMIAEWPSSNDTGVTQTISSINISHCSPVDVTPPAHCFDFTSHAGDTADDTPVCNLTHAAGITDPQGIGIVMYSQPNINGGAFNSAGCAPFANLGHSLVGIMENLGAPGCLGASTPTVIATLSANFTQPNVSSTVSTTMSAVINNTPIYVVGCGWYSSTTGTSTPILTNLGFPGNISTGSICTSPTNVQLSNFPDTPNAANGGCFFDQLIYSMLAEFEGSIGTFHGQGWASQVIGELHEPCLILGKFSNTFNSPNGVQFPSNFGFTDTGTRYDFLLPNWFHSTQGGVLVNQGAGANPCPGGAPCGYCSNQNYSNYWSTLCKQNSDCPAVSGVCSGTKPFMGSHCLAPSCSDGIQNGDETDIDCGGAECNGCPAGKHCGSLFDCFFGVPEWCIGGVCAQ